MAEILDYASGPPRAADIAADGFIGVIRYLSPARPGAEGWMTGKPLRRAEVHDLQVHGLGIAACWQFGAGSVGESDVMRGYEGGLQDARAADNTLADLDLGALPVFFAVDFDISLDQWNNTAVHYFRGCVDVLGVERVGIYGHSRACDWAREDGVIGPAGPNHHLMWQTTAWSGGVVHSRAVLLQYRHNVPGPSGVLVDVNAVRHPWWGQSPPGVEPGTETPEEPPPMNSMFSTEQFLADRDLLTSRDTGVRNERRLWVCLHTDESAVNNPAGPAWTADRLAEYNREVTDPMGARGSYHLGIDRTGRVVRQNDDIFGSWSVASSGNNTAFHICLTGTAHQSRDQWFSHVDQLTKAADVVAHYCLLYGIDIRRAVAGDLRANVSGICGHGDFTAGLGGTTHWDPGGYGDMYPGVVAGGGGFPWDDFVGMVHEAADRRR